MSFSAFFRDHPRLAWVRILLEVEQLLALDAGDKLLLFTDGIVEAENLELEEFGDERLRLEAAIGERRSIPSSV